MGRTAFLSSCHRFTLGALLLLALASSAFAQSFSIEANVDRTTVKFGESLQLAITVMQSMSSGNERIGAPQLTNIPGFDIAGQQSSQNMTIINGVGKIQIQTAINLVPQRDGDFTIPALSMKGPDGKVYSTKPIQIKVLPPEKEADESASPSGTEANQASDEDGKPSGENRLLKFALVIIFVLGSIIVAPILLSYLLNRDSKPSTRWKNAENVSASANSSPGASANGLVRPMPGIRETCETPESRGSGEIRENRDTREKRFKEEVEDAIIAPSGKKTLDKIDFEREVASLQRGYPDGGVDFFREFFVLFRQAALYQSKALDENMTPDELIRQLVHLLPSNLGSRALALGENWEAVSFARVVPGRQWRAILEDALLILAAISQHQQE